MDSSGMDRIPPAAAGAGTDHLTRTSWGNITLPSTQQTFQGQAGGHEAWLLKPQT